MRSKRFLARVTMALAAVGILSCQAESLPEAFYRWDTIQLPPVAVKADIFYGNMDTLLQKRGVLFTASSDGNHHEAASVADINRELGAR